MQTNFRHYFQLIHASLKNDVDLIDYTLWIMGSHLFLRVAHSCCVLLIFVAIFRETAKLGRIPVFVGWLRQTKGGDYFVIICYWEYYWDVLCIWNEQYLADKSFSRRFPPDQKMLYVWFSRWFKGRQFVDWWPVSVSLGLHSQKRAPA